MQKQVKMIYMIAKILIFAQNTHFKPDNATNMENNKIVDSLFVGTNMNPNGDVRITSNDLVESFADNNNVSLFSAALAPNFNTNDASKLNENILKLDSNLKTDEDPEKNKKDETKENKNGTDKDKKDEKNEGKNKIEEKKENDSGTEKKVIKESKKDEKNNEQEKNKKDETNKKDEKNNEQEKNKKDENKNEQLNKKENEQEKNKKDETYKKDENKTELEKNKNDESKNNLELIKKDESKTEEINKNNQINKDKSNQELNKKDENKIENIQENKKTNGNETDKKEGNDEKNNLYNKKEDALNGENSNTKQTYIDKEKNKTDFDDKKENKMDLNNEKESKNKNENQKDKPLIDLEKILNKKESKTASTSNISNEKNGQLNKDGKLNKDSIDGKKLEEYLKLKGEEIKKSEKSKPAEIKNKKLEDTGNKVSQNLNKNEDDLDTKPYASYKTQSMDPNDGFIDVNSPIKIEIQIKSKCCGESTENKKMEPKKLHENDNSKILSNNNNIQSNYSKIDEEQNTDASKKIEDIKKESINQKNDSKSDINLSKSDSNAKKDTKTGSKSNEENSNLEKNDKNKKNDISITSSSPVINEDDQRKNEMKQDIKNSELSQTNEKEKLEDKKKLENESSTNLILPPKKESEIESIKKSNETGKNNEEYKNKENKSVFKDGLEEGKKMICIFSKYKDLMKKEVKNQDKKEIISKILIYKNKNNLYVDYWGVLEFQENNGKFVDKTGFYEGELVTNVKNLIEKGHLTRNGFIQSCEIPIKDIKSQIAITKKIISMIGEKQNKKFDEIISENCNLNFTDQLIFTKLYSSGNNENLQCVCANKNCNEPCKEINFI